MSKFKVKDNRTFSEKAKSFGQSLLFWKGRSKGMIHTRDLEWDDLRYIFFPSKLEKYGYLNITFYKDDSPYYLALLPLVLAMDHEAKPKWCPRWFLRFLHVFGDDKSVVRVRNRTLHNLHKRLTKGIMFCKSLLGDDTRWVQTSYNSNFRKNYAGIGMSYDPINDWFVSPQPYLSWTLDADAKWQAPTPYPADKKLYSWNEETLSWDEVIV
jgi:hypothetical protein